MIYFFIKNSFKVCNKVYKMLISLLLSIYPYSVHMKTHSFHYYIFNPTLYLIPIFQVHTYSRVAPTL